MFNKPPLSLGDQLALALLARILSGQLLPAARPSPRRYWLRSLEPLDALLHALRHLRSARFDFCTHNSLNNLNTLNYV